MEKLSFIALAWQETTIDAILYLAVLGKERLDPRENLLHY